jgi:thymidylate kinase
VAKVIVAFSGVDGSGKSRISAAVVEALREAGIDAVYSVPDYPSYSLFKRHIDNTSGDPYNFYGDPRYGRLAICAIVLDWLAWWEIHQPLLADGVVLCCDRYLADVHAQAMQLDVDSAELCAELRVLPPADLNILFRADPALVRKRIEARVSAPPNRSESLPWLAKLTRIFDGMMADPQWNFTPLSAIRPPADIVADVRDRVLDRLGGKARRNDTGHRLAHDGAGQGQALRAGCLLP